MTAALPFDAELLRRHDWPGPRYTSYPTAHHFSAEFGEAAFREAAKFSNGDPIPRRLSLYVHVPFCLSPCFYRDCNCVITHDKARAEPYVTRLVREVGMVAPLFDRDRDVIQLHLGGGTPNFLDARQLGELLESLGRHFHFSSAGDRDFSIQLDSRCVKDGDIEALAFMGFNRASLIVQDFDPAVQAAVNRIQSVEQTLAVIDACRARAFRTVNVDLIYGLPKQDRVGFGRTLDAVIAARPDRIAICNYVRWSHVVSGQTQFDDGQLPSADDRLGLWQSAVEKLTAAGYRYLGMNQFALPTDDLSRAQERGGLHRNLLGYATHPESDLIGLGAGAISHIGDTYSQNLSDVPNWEAAIDAGRAPLWRGLSMSADDRLRADLIEQLLCRREIDIPVLEDRHDVDFARYFAPDLQRLQPLIADGLVEISATTLCVTSRGYLLLPAVAACFDGHLHPSPAKSPQP
jgi:oxygen-independent coproporphyrinogen-3 oxidase